jgi:hypothetical protein
MHSARSGRYAGEQLRKLVGEHDFAFLIVEGLVRPNPQTAVMEQGWFKPRDGDENRGWLGWYDVRVGQSGFPYSEMDNFLTTQALHTPVKVKWSPDAPSTATQLVNLYRWFNDKEWEEHKSCFAIYTPPPPTVMLVKPSVVRRVAVQLEHVGWERSGPLAQRFRTVLDLCIATERELQEVVGIGPSIAQSIVRQLTEPERS